MGGAEFYPSCTQVQISGSGTGTPNDTVMFPGGYSDSDPGIYVPDVSHPAHFRRPYWHERSYLSTVVGIRLEFGLRFPWAFNLQSGLPR